MKTPGVCTVLTVLPILLVYTFYCRDERAALTAATSRNK